MVKKVAAAKVVPAKQAPKIEKKEKKEKAQPKLVKARSSTGS